MKNKVPTFTLRADDPDALRAIFAYGAGLEKPSEKRDRALDAALEFSKWRDDNKGQGPGGIDDNH